MLDLDAVLDHALRAADEAGEALMRYFGKTLETHTKSSSDDFSTDADHAAEAIIVEALSAQYPDHHIVAEEGGGYGAPKQGASYRWYIDPLDGTINFANGIPYFAVSIALTDDQDEPLVGVIYHPPLRERFCAVKDQGTTLNGQPIRVSKVDNLDESIVSSGFPYAKKVDPDNNTREWSAMIPRVRGLRRMGSAAIDLSYVAAGRLEAHWERNLSPWDYMAGVLCVREAGGLVTDLSGQSQLDLKAGKVAASNGHVHEALIGILSG